MNPKIMTLERLATISAIHDLVGTRPDHRWGRASLVGRRSDGHSIASWFDAHSTDYRVQLVRESILSSAPWSDLLRVQIPKKNGIDTRAVDMPVVVDQARLYPIADWASQHAEAVLSPVAVAFRRGRQLHQTILGAHEDALSRPFACVIDIKGFYDNVSWSLADQAIDKFPADEAVKLLLGDLVRAPVIDRKTREPIGRTMGLVQGLSPSPVLANLILNDWDRQVAHAVSKFGVSIRRYCDDILLLAASMTALLRAVEIVTDRLARLGFRVKEGTGRPVNTRQEEVTWLGVSIGPEGLRVPEIVIVSKAREIQGDIDHGVLSSQGLEDLLIGLLEHYRRVLPLDRAQTVITQMRERLDLSQLSQEKEVSKTLKHLFTDHTSHGLKHREMDALDGNQWSKKTEQEPKLDQIWIGHCSGMLGRPDAKTRASSTGAPAQSAPAAVENGTVWRIGVWVDGPHQAHVIARRVDDQWHEGWAFADKESLSVPEIVVRALADGLRRLHDRGATEVTVVVTDRTLHGYGWRGWDVRSLRMHVALQQLQSARASIRLLWQPGRRFAKLATSHHLGVSS